MITLTVTSLSVHMDTFKNCEAPLLNVLNHKADTPNVLYRFHAVLNRFSLEGGACNMRNRVLIFWMTKFQHVASSARKSVVISPASRLHTHVGL